MTTLLQERPSTYSAKQKQRSHRGTSEKARGHREVTSRRAQPASRQSTRPAATPQPATAKEVITLPAIQTARRRSTLEIFFESFSLVKGFTLFGFAVGALHVILFGLDLAIGWPLQRASVLYDINSVVCGLALACLSWDTFRDQVREAR